MIGTKIRGTPTCRGFGEQGKGGFISRIQGNKGQILREMGEQRQYCLFVPLFPHRGTREQVTPWVQRANYANSESSGESAHLSLAWAYVSEPKPHVLAQMSFFKLFLCEQRSLWRNCTIAWSSLSLRHSSKILCWLKWRCNTSLCKQRRLWRVYTFAQAYLSLRHCTKISCAVSNGDLCAIHASSVDSGESLHICTCIFSGQCNKYQYYICWQRRLLRVCSLHRLARVLFTPAA